MTEQDRLLGHYAHFLLPWLEEQKAKKVSELIGLRRQKEETGDKVTEIMLLTDQISAIKAKAEALGKQKVK